MKIKFYIFSRAFIGKIRLFTCYLVKRNVNFTILQQVGIQYSDLWHFMPRSPRSVKMFGKTFFFSFLFPTIRPYQEQNKRERKKKTSLPHSFYTFILFYFSPSLFKISLLLVSPQRFLLQPSVKKPRKNRKVTFSSPP